MLTAISKRLDFSTRSSSDNSFEIALIFFCIKNQNSKHKTKENIAQNHCIHSSKNSRGLLPLSVKGQKTNITNPKLLFLKKIVTIFH